jgi:hypothetical protein
MPEAFAETLRKANIGEAPVERAASLTRNYENSHDCVADRPRFDISQYLGRRPIRFFSKRFFVEQSNTGGACILACGT